MNRYHDYITANYPKEIVEIYDHVREQVSSGELCACHTTDDGRLNSALDEEVVIASLIARFPDNVVKVKTRNWFDFPFMTRGKTLVFNIKCSTGKTDNAMNKKALVYSLTPLEPEEIPGSMTYNRMRELIDEHLNDRRNPDKEYYYMYIDKNDKTVLVKSVLDVQNLVSNPCNILQINWTKEKRDAHVFNNADPATARRRLFDVIEKSIRQQFAGCSKFIAGD